MKRETAKRLHDALTACQEARGVCDGVPVDAFVADRILQLAVQKLVENVGESLRQAELTDAETVRTIPELRVVVDTRNRLIHGYDSVDYAALWDIVQRHVPSLERQIARLLEQFPPSAFQRAFPDEQS
jgi:uncharacterized protein with HEPN domain